MTDSFLRLRKMRQLASREVRVQARMTAVVLFVASATVYASTVEGPQPGTGPAWVTPQTILAIAGIVYGVGMLVQEMRDLRRKIGELESEAGQASKNFARTEVVDLRFIALLTEVHSLRDDVGRNAQKESIEHVEVGRRFDAFAARMETFMGGLETKLHEAEKDIVRLKASHR